MEILFLTGLSGAGKSVAVSCLEDMGFFCIDNLPVELIGRFVALCRKQRGSPGRYALVVDIRAVHSFDALLEALSRMSRKPGETVRLLFLDATDPVIISRYKQTRRRHPLLDQAPDIQSAIARERAMLSPVRARADYIIDTTKLDTAQLRDRLHSLFERQKDDSFEVQLISFGFKNGIPADADLMIDVRCLPNPFYIEQLRPLTGLDAPVYDYVMGFAQTQQLLDKLYDLGQFLLPLYIREGKTYLVVAVGCTGGQHRSVSIARALAGHLQQLGYRTRITHRDIKR